MKKIINIIHRFLIPSEKNNFRAKALHLDFLTYYLIFAFVLVIGFKSFHHYLYNVLGYATDISVGKLYELTNKEREVHNLTPLKYNEKLSQAALDKAKDMFAKNYWAHYGPDGSTPWDFIMAANYQYEYAGENLAKNFLFSQGVVDAWMNSPTHRDNILKQEYTEIGFAIVNGVLNDEETTLVVQMFGKPTNSFIPQLDQPKKELLPETEPLPEERVLAKEIKKPAISIFNFSFDLIYFFIIFLAIILIADFYVASKLNIIRINGKNIAHIIFLGFVFISLVLIIQKGAIL